MYTVLWQDDGKDKWDRLENEEEVRILIDELTENPNVCESDIWIFLPEADGYAITPDML